MGEELVEIRECLHCGKEFKVGRPWQMYCSRVCGDKHYRMTYKKPKKKKAVKQNTLAEMQKAASDAGMTYGKYVDSLRGNIVWVRGLRDG